MATMGSPATPPPIKYTSFCREEDQRLFTEGKLFLKYCNISKTLRGEGGPSANEFPPSPLYHGWGLTLHVCPRASLSP